jgi:hypothetical protein
MVCSGDMGRAELAFWTTVRHVTRKAANEAPDEVTYRAYETVIGHAQNRVDHYLCVVSGSATSPPTPPKPKSA